MAVVINWNEYSTRWQINCFSNMTNVVSTFPQFLIFHRSFSWLRNSLCFQGPFRDAIQIIRDTLGPPSIDKKYHVDFFCFKNSNINALGSKKTCLSAWHFIPNSFYSSNPIEISFFYKSIGQTMGQPARFTYLPKGILPHLNPWTNTIGHSLKLAL